MDIFASVFGIIFVINIVAVVTVYISHWIASVDREIEQKYGLNPNPKVSPLAFGLVVVNPYSTHDSFEGTLAHRLNSASFARSRVMRYGSQGLRFKDLKEPYERFGIFPEALEAYNSTLKK